MIGDNLDADIEGAVNAGLHAIWFNHHKEIVEANHHPTIHQLIDLKQLL
jgi:putative hydrolase of the HAD superfamily